MAESCLNCKTCVNYSGYCVLEMELDELDEYCFKYKYNRNFKNLNIEEEIDNNAFLYDW